ncbi:hypothetical protein Tco_1491624 [Tanacetum coccineum]
MQQIAASLEDKMTIKMNQMMNQMKALVVTTPAPVKAVEERCTTCGNNHSFNVCPMTRGGYEYPVYHDNFQQFQQTASVGNFVQNGNSGYRAPNLANQMRPPGFNQPNPQASRPNQGYNANQGAKTKCACCVRGFSSKSQPSIAFVLLWSQSQPLKILWEWCGIANMALIQLGGSGRVGEMILARERSGFAG